MEKEYETSVILSAHLLINNWRGRALETTDISKRKDFRKKADDLEDELIELDDDLFTLIVDDEGEIHEPVFIKISPASDSNHFKISKA